MRVGRFSIVLIAALVGGCDWLLLMSHEMLESHYATYEEVIRDGAVVRGWIPAFLPHSAEQIREVHNIDTNEAWVFFEFAEEDRPTLEAVCASTPRSSVTLPRDHPTTKHVSWWSAQLKGLASIAEEEFAFYHCRDEHLSDRAKAYLALERSRARAWFWRSVH
jgi:hypothetical protein